MHVPVSVRNPNKPIATALTAVAVFAGSSALSGCGAERDAVSPAVPANTAPATPIPNQLVPKGAPKVEDKGNGVQVVTMP